MRALAQCAVDAAKAAGAAYADARVTRDVWQRAVPTSGQLDHREHFEYGSYGIGVRALVNGAWGFSASPTWTLDQATQLGNDATAQARANSKWVADRVELAPASVTRGTWTTPHRIDPFTVSIREKEEYLQSLRWHDPYLRREYSLSSEVLFCQCWRQERTIATTEGGLFSQVFYSTVLKWESIATFPGIDWQGNKTNVDQDLQRNPHIDVKEGTGWETVLDANLRVTGPQLAEQVLEDARKPAHISVKPASVGRYTVVMDASAVAQLIAVTVGIAGDLDRIVGFEANAGGTSHFGNDPFSIAGKLSLGSELLSVTAIPDPRRKWDDEGVEPVSFPMVKNGVWQNFATTRAQAAWLAPLAQRFGEPIRSHGCATSTVWSDPVTCGSPELVMTPSTQHVTFQDLVASTPRGIAITAAIVRFDYQVRQLTISVPDEAPMREIINGRLGAAYPQGAFFVIDAVQLWKNLQALGGKQEMQPGSVTWEKGQPGQSVTVNARAVPGVFTDIPLLLARR